MKQYPTITRKPSGNATKFWAFDKLDGSNIRVEWTKKKGFHKFGSRKRLLGTDQGILASAEQLAYNQEPVFANHFMKEKVDRAICFFEFHGPNSFAGCHDSNDSHELTLIDVAIYKKGPMHPKDFVKSFYNGKFNVPKLLHSGPVDEVFRNSVLRGDLEGMTFEGVVCKAGPDRKGHPLNMFKIKNEDWITKVKAQYDSSRWQELL